MSRILITSGPTRQYLDPVRYLTNASSGRMGKALAEAAIEAGHEVVIVSGPVDVEYPPAARVIDVVSTEEMLAAAREAFAVCDGLIGVAAPCDYRPVKVETENETENGTGLISPDDRESFGKLDLSRFPLPNKIAKTGRPLVVHLIETDDIVATLGRAKGDRWAVGFALETEDRRLRALAKLEKKSCDLMVLNGPEAMHSPNNHVEVIDPTGSVLQAISGTKEHVAREIFRVIQERLID